MGMLRCDNCGGQVMKGVNIFCLLIYKQKNANAELLSPAWYVQVVGL